MADTKITALTALTAADPANDVIPIVDVSDTTMAASGTTKKISVNNILGASGTATLASATITGDLTVDTNVLKVDSTNNRVGINFTSPTVPLYVQGNNATATAIMQDETNGAKLRLLANSINFDITNGGGGGDIAVSGANPLTFRINGTEQMRLNSTGLGVGATPGERLTIQTALTGTTVGSNTVGRFQSNGSGYDAHIALGDNVNPSARIGYLSSAMYFWTNGAERVRIDSSGNVGVGGSPSYKVSAIGTTDNQVVLHVGNTAGSTDGDTTNVVRFAAGSGANALWANARYDGFSHAWRCNSTTTQAMTLDASGNLLVGVASGTTHVIKKTLTPDVGNVVLDIYGNNTSATFYSVGSYAANAANAAAKFGRDGFTLRSINAGGTVNASGADYAEYMVKCGNFVIAKGDVAGIDANGKLTNVFADAVSFVVKSTDPSYVGNDKWGVDLEGDALETARQLVDRIAFAGQVPVNVTGAKAGDYIVPVVNGTGIKGISVSKPTFEQYQLAVGKVIAIDADGRARIIVKVA